MTVGFVYYIIVLRKEVKMLEIKFARIRKGLTQEELGEKIGVNKVTISAYELGKIKPSLDALSCT